MNGRIEHEIIIEEKINNLIKSSNNSYLEGFYFSLSNNTATTKNVYVRYVNDFCSFFKSNDILKLKPSDINRYMEHIKYKSGSNIENKASIRGARLAAIRKFYDYLLMDGIVNANPCDKIKPPKDHIEKEIVAMTPDEVSTLKNNIVKINKTKWSSRDLAIVTLGCNTGLRCTAITEINMEDIDFENRTIRVVEKGNKVKNVYLGESTMKSIVDWCINREKLLGDTQCNALFISERKQRIAQRTIREMLAKYTKCLGKHISPHKMRSTCATNLYEQTGDIYLVASVLGHSNIQTTRRYAKMSNEKRENAASLLDKLF